MTLFSMMSGLPRSGSTVLGSILNQHPDIYASTTSPVIELISNVTDIWPNISAALINPHPSQLDNIVNGIITGAYSHISEKVVVDKNRLWPRFIPLLQRSLRNQPKIICTVRNIPDILASYILLINKDTNITFIDQDLINENLPINNKNRCRIIWERYVSHPYNSLRVGYNSSNTDLLFLEYEDIVNNGQAVADQICKFLEIDTFTINQSALKPMNENDKFHGGIAGLHDIRPTLSKVSPPPEQVIGHELTNYYRNMKLEFWRK